jgi:microcystin-dependent protein
MRDIATKAIGAKFYYQDCNSMASEEKNLVGTSGQTLDEADNFQLAKATAIYVAVGNFYTDTGTANHYTLAPVGAMQMPLAYQEGMSVRFRALNENTGASDITVAGLGTVQIKKEDSITELGAGDIVGGQINEVIYNSYTNCFELYSHKYEDQVFDTGDNIITDATGNRSGWIWINDNTKTRIGDATSIPTNSIRANADCEALFKLYWNGRVDADCPVIGGRGASANADWTAHKQITIPDSFRRVLAAHDINDTLRIGQVEGSKTAVLTDPSMNAAHGHGVSDPSHAHSSAFPVNTPRGINGSGGSTNFYMPESGTTPVATSPSGTGIGIQSSGSGAAHLNMQPTVYKNLYIKL